MQQAMQPYVLRWSPGRVGNGNRCAKRPESLCEQHPIILAQFVKNEADFSAPLRPTCVFNRIVQWFGYGRSLRCSPGKVTIRPILLQPQLPEHAGNKLGLVATARVEPRVEITALQTQNELVCKRVCASRIA